MSRRGNAVFRAALVFLATSMTACSVPVAGALEERDANLVANALIRSGIDASKESDPASEGRYRIMVASDDAAPAIATLRDHDLPPRHAPGVVDSMGKGSLVPSPTAEHASFVTGVAGDLERTLSTVDGVLGSRVHLSIPVPSPLSDKPADKPTASVLIKYAGAHPPIAEADVRRLIAGAVANLAPDSVTIVMVGRPAAAAVPDRPLAHFGPISVTRSSALWLRLHLGVTLVFLLGLVAAVLYLWARLRRTADPSASGDAN